MTSESCWYPSDWCVTNRDQGLFTFADWNVNTSNILVQSLHHGIRWQNSLEMQPPTHDNNTHLSQLGSINTVIFLVIRSHISLNQIHSIYRTLVQPLLAFSCPGVHSMKKGREWGEIHYHTFLVAGLEAGINCSESHQLQQLIFLNSIYFLQVFAFLILFRFQFCM